MTEPDELPVGPRLNRQARHMLGATAVLLVAAAFSGGAGSIVLPLLVGAQFLLLRVAAHPIALLTPLLAAVLLLVASWLGAGIDARAAFGSIGLIVGSYPGLLWRRESKRAAGRLALLDEIHAQVERTGTARGAARQAAAQELADLERALGSVAARLGATAAALWDADAYRGRLRPHSSWGHRPPTQLRLSGDPLGWVWEQGIRLRLEPTPRWAPPATVVVAERLRREDEHGELVSFVFPSGAELPDADTLDQASIYLRGILALQEARAASVANQRRVDTLLSGLRGIPGELDLAPLARDLCDTAMAVTDATGAAIGFWDGEHGEVLAVTGSDGGPQPGDAFTAPGSELALAIRADTLVARNGRDWSWGRTALAHPEERWKERPRALAVLPLRGPAGVIGVLAVWSSETSAFDGDALELLHLMEPYAAVHLEHARAFGRLRETADRDPLTQLRNRRAFEEIFAAETTRFERYGRPLALMMLDIDHFKAVNDVHGHEAGDEVLRRVARVIAAGVRDADTAARYGGEEFVVLLPETALDAAADVAERIRKAVADMRVDWRGVPIPVHISIGVSAAPGPVSHPRELITSADTALYGAKAAGRDRVVTA